MNTPALTLMGKVKPLVIKKITKSSATKLNDNWFFVDYTSNEFKIGESFDILFQGRKKTLIPKITDIKLRRVYNQMGHELEYIPGGFQTICNFDFRNKMPEQIKDLPSLSTWKYNVNSISIANHQSVRLVEPDLFIKSLYGVILVELKKQFDAGSSGISKKELTLFLMNNYKFRKVDIPQIFKDLKSLGLARDQHHKELELISQ
jgi:hypothetical protein